MDDFYSCVEINLCYYQSFLPIPCLDHELFSSFRVSFSTLNCCSFYCPDSVGDCVTGRRVWINCGVLDEVNSKYKGKVSITCDLEKEVADYEGEADDIAAVENDIKSLEDVSAENVHGFEYICVLCAWRQ